MREDRAAPRRLRRFLARGVPLALAVAGLAACDQVFPTALPSWDTEWVIPGKSTTISVGTLVQNTGVTLAAGGSAFQLSLSGVTFARTLGELCSVCQSGSVPVKPAFTATLSGTIPLPANVLGATVQSGQVVLSMRNGLSFDPLRPPGSTTRGTVTTTVRSGTTVLVTDVIRDTTWSPGSTLSRTIAVSNVNVTGPLSVAVEIASPAGGAVTINTAQSISITATPQSFLLSQAQVVVTNQTVNAAQVDLDLEDIDATIADRVRGGAILLDVSNPFAASGTLTLRITQGGALVTSKTVQLQPAATTTGTQIALSESELQSILGQPDVRLSVTGTVGTPPSGTTVRPTQSVSIASRLRLTIGLGGE